MSPLLKYLRKLSISQKFYAIIAIVAVILAFELASFWFALSTVSNIRSYVQGEGLWSKSQKESLNSLLRYTTSFRQSDYDTYLSALAVPLGDSQARLELEKQKPDLSIARQGFLQGGNNPADVTGMIFLFQYFREVSYMKQAINIWSHGDTLIQTQLKIGAQIHAIIAAPSASKDPRGIATYNKVRPLILEAVKNDSTLTPLENQFSTIMGDASRQVGEMLFYAVLALTLVLGLFALAVALFISRLMTQVDQAKTEFIALTSHQLRSPLNVINLSVELLKNLNPHRSIEEHDAIESISREVWQMSALIEATLNVSRIELGKLVIEPETIDIIAFIRAQVEALALVARKKGLHLQGSYSPEKLMISMDAVLLQVILQNLLSNAIKYTPDGGSIDVAVEGQPSRILIRVTDTGDGIPKEHRRHIFSKLYRTPNARKSGVEGTGLGLYMVKSIVTKAGGNIWFESEEAVGTTFFITFPLSGMKEMRGDVRL